VTHVSTDAPVPEIDVDELARLQEQGAHVLDVRQPDEYEAGHVPGAQLIPLDQLSERVGEVPAEGPLYVICRSGSRSAVAVQALTGAGYDATNVAGGTLAWVESGRPVVEGPHAR
jgi:rhodanese-related sulfurtransferase